MKKIKSRSCLRITFVVKYDTAFPEMSIWENQFAVYTNKQLNEIAQLECKLVIVWPLIMQCLSFEAFRVLLVVCEEV